MSEYSEKTRREFTAGDDIRDAGLTTPNDVVRVDDIRFHRAAPGETNVTVVARYDGATSNGSGVYNVIGTWDFSAWDATTRLGSTRRLLGYKLDDGDLVPNPRTGENGKMTYTYAAGAGSGTPQRDGTAHKRLTWVWEVKGIQMLYH